MLRVPTSAVRYQKHLPLQKKTCTLSSSNFWGSTSTASTTAPSRASASAITRPIPVKLVCDKRNRVSKISWHQRRPRIPHQFFQQAFLSSLALGPGGMPCLIAQGPSLDIGQIKQRCTYLCSPTSQHCSVNPMSYCIYCGGVGK